MFGFKNYEEMYDCFKKNKKGNIFKDVDCLISYDDNINGGERWVFKCNENYGASVIFSAFSYGSEEGLFELAVIKFDGDNYHLTYETEITDDVVGYLAKEEVIEILEKIKKIS